MHLDYSIHPTLRPRRWLSLIVYITSGWKSEWWGQLSLWEGSRDKMVKLCRKVDCLFNRAVISDTTQDSWPGLADAMRCPRGVICKSLAVYYLTAPRSGAAERGKALFAPHGEPKNDPAVFELIKKRSQVAAAEKVYRKYPRKT